MVFFDLFKPSTWLSSAEKGIMGAIVNGVRTLLFWVDTLIYELIGWLYDIFEMLCEVRILDDSVLKVISQRLGVILGLIMFFSIVFSFVQMMLDPEKITDKEKGAASIIKKALLVIVMLGVSNFAFTKLYEIQKEILGSHVISRLILPYQVDEGAMNNFGNELSAQLMGAFYRVDNFEERTDLSVDSDNNIQACEAMTNSFYTQIRKNRRFDLGYTCLNEYISVTMNNTTQNEDDETYIIYFNGIISVFAGGFVVYMLFMYCFKIGVRMVQLAFLEIISPMAFISYLSPKKDTMLSKWWKIYFSTYIDVFIRMAIIYFIIFLISVIFAGMDGNTMGGAFTFWNTLTNLDGKTQAFISVVVILALLTFAKKAPELLKELIPASASKLGFGANMKDIFGLKETVGMVTGAGVASAIGLLGGAASGGIFGAVSGALGGMFRGGAAGAKSKGIWNAMTTARANQAKANVAAAQRRLAGAHWYDGVGKGVNDFFGNISDFERLDAEVSSYNDLKSDIEGEDVVKHAQTTLDLAYQEYYRNETEHGRTALSKTEWLETAGLGKDFKKKLDDAKDEAYSKLYNNPNSAFHAKVDMHNRRFATRYGARTKWDAINSTRKNRAGELERKRAQKPK